MALNAYQRIWVVVTICWGIVVGYEAWRSWPRPTLVHSYFVSGEEIDYTDAVQQIVQHGAIVMQEPPYSVHVPRPNEPVGMRIAIPNIGTVRFPSSMTPEQVAVASKELYEDHQNRLNRENNAAMRKAKEGRRTVAAEAAVVWAIPSVALYALGWTAAWVLRGRTGAKS